MAADSYHHARRNHSCTAVCTRSPVPSSFRVSGTELGAARAVSPESGRTEEHLCLLLSPAAFEENDVESYYCRHSVLTTTVRVLEQQPRAPVVAQNRTPAACRYLRAHRLDRRDISLALGERVCIACVYRAHRGIRVGTGQTPAC